MVTELNLYKVDFREIEATNQNQPNSFYMESTDLALCAVVPFDSPSILVLAKWRAVLCKAPHFLITYKSYIDLRVLA